MQHLHIHYRQGENPCQDLLVLPGLMSVGPIYFLCVMRQLKNLQPNQGVGTQNAIVGYEYTTSPEQTGTIDENKMCQVVLSKSIAVKHYNPILATINPPLCQAPSTTHMSAYHYTNGMLSKRMMYEVHTLRFSRGNMVVDPRREAFNATSWIPVEPSEVDCRCFSYECSPLVPHKKKKVFVHPP